MTHHICPICGCEIKSDGYEKDGINYCCKPCAESGRYECGCYHPQATDMPDAGGE